MIMIMNIFFIDENPSNIAKIRNKKTRPLDDSVFSAAMELANEMA